MNEKIKDTSVINAAINTSVSCLEDSFERWFFGSAHLESRSAMKLLGMVRVKSSGGRLEF